MSNAGICRWEGYGFQSVSSGIGNRNQILWVENRVSLAGKLNSGMKRKRIAIEKRKAIETRKRKRLS